MVQSYAGRVDAGVWLKDRAVSHQLVQWRHGGLLWAWLLLSNRDGESLWWKSEGWKRGVTESKSHDPSVTETSSTVFLLFPLTHDDVSLLSVSAATPFTANQLHQNQILMIPLKETGEEGWTVRVIQWSGEDVKWWLNAVVKKRSYERKWWIT